MAPPLVLPDAAVDPLAGLAADIADRAAWVAALTQQNTGVALIDGGQRYRAVSAAFAAFSGRSPEAFVGRRVTELGASPALERALAGIAAGSGGHTARAGPFEEGASPFPGAAAADWSLTPVAGAGGQAAGALLLVHDVSARTRALQAARAREAELEAVLVNLPVTAYRGGRDWSIEAMAGVERLTGYSVADINALSGRFCDLIHPEDRERVLAEVRRLPEDGATLVQRYRIITRQGEVREIEDRKRRVLGDPLRRVEGVLSDVGEQRAEERRLRESDARFRALLSTTMDGYWMVDGDKRIVDVNEAYCRMSGYTREELLALRIADLEGRESDADVRACAARIQATGSDIFESVHRRKDGSLWPVEVSVSRLPDSGRMSVFIRDISARKRAEGLLEARLELGALALQGDAERLMQAALDAAEALTGSTIGYFHFVDADGVTLRLQTWSTHTIRHMCQVQVKGQHYPLDKAGIWADCVHTSAPVICNDYPGHAGKKGMPEGHATVSRFVSVPVIRDGRVVAVLGVGNKADDYDADDALLVTQLGGFAWEGVERIRIQERIATTETTLRLAQRVAHLGSIELNLVDGSAVWSPEIRKLLGVDEDYPLDREYFFARIAAGYRETVGHAWKHLARGIAFDLEHRMVAPIERRESFMWMHQRGEVVRWDGARPLIAVVTLQDISEHKHAQEEISRLEHFDPLTTLPNRTLFNLRYRHSLEKANRRQSKLALLMLDIDLFKHINEALGHSTGDQLLIRVADRLRNRLRGEDLLARLGGDEFAILVDDLKEPADAARIAKDLQQALEKPIVISEDLELSVSASLGIAIYPDDAREPEALLSAADAALYQAKAQGRQIFRFYRESLTAAAQDRIRMESRLHKALQQNQFVLHYQPLWAGEPLAPVGAEALIRWNDPEDGLISPLRFIPVAEDSGFIVPLGRWVLETACRQMRAWLDEGRPIETMAVNVSARQFALGDVVADVEAALSAAGLPGRHLEVEITEGTLLDRGEHTAAALAALHALGVKIAIDDFGTGYSSLTYLKRYPIDKLKIDQSFVRDLPGEASSSRIVAAIVAMGRALNLTVLAEGVETEAQHGCLAGMGCDFFQGYLFGRPVPAEQFPNRRP